MRVAILWKNHNETEENIMRDLLYPYAASHVGSHVDITERIANVTVLSSKYEIVDLIEVLLNHIDNQDQQLGEFVKNACR